MGIVDFVLLSAGLVGLIAIIAMSPTSRIVVLQSVFHPLERGHIAIWDENVEYFKDPPIAQDPNILAPATPVQADERRRAGRVDGDPNILAPATPVQESESGPLSDGTGKKEAV